MSSANAYVLQERPFRLDVNDGFSTSGVWYDGKPLTTQLLNAYTLLIPNGERFIIRSCRRYLSRIAPELGEELERLFFQEGSHSREHGRLLKAMRADGLSLDSFRKFVEWWSYHLLEPLTPPKLHLATAAAIEHHNAVIASFFLDQELLKGVRTGELRRLFLWHFAEEIEHKETVFKLLQSVSGTWLLRALGLFFSFSTFLLYWVLATLLLGVKTRSVLKAGFWRELLFRQRDGLCATVVKESWRYLKPGFRPSLDESRILHASALYELERVGVE